MFNFPGSGVALSKLDAVTPKPTPTPRRGDGPLVADLTAAQIADAVGQGSPLSLPHDFAVVFTQEDREAFAQAVQRGWLTLDATYTVDRYRRPHIAGAEDAELLAAVWSWHCAKAVAPYAVVRRYSVPRRDPVVIEHARVPISDGMQIEAKHLGHRAVQIDKRWYLLSSQMKEPGDIGGSFASLHVAFPVGKMLPTASHRWLAGVVEEARYRGQGAFPPTASAQVIACQRVEGAQVEAVVGEILRHWRDLPPEAKTGAVFQTAPAPVPPARRARDRWGVAG